MYQLSLRFILMPLLISMLSCSEINDFFFPEEEAPIPANLASVDEERMIHYRLSQIQEYLGQMGSKTNLKTVPIIVVNENPSETHRWGYCQYKSTGGPHFIAINKAVFEREKLITGMKTSFLFAVLLHEIGHCYFGLDHDNASLKVNGYYMVITVRGIGGKTLRYLDEFPLSVMNVGIMSDVPNGLEKYFVAEILGGPRVRKVSDIRKYIPIYLKKKIYENGDTLPTPRPAPIAEEDDDDWWPWP